MAHIITIKSSARAVVVSEKIVDGGRERFENGRDDLTPGVEQEFLAHEGQSLRVVVLPPETEQPADDIDEISSDDIGTVPDSIIKGEQA